MLFPAVCHSRTTYDLIFCFVTEPFLYLLHADENVSGSAPVTKRGSDLCETVQEYEKVQAKSGL